MCQGRFHSKLSSLHCQPPHQNIGPDQFNKFYFNRKSSCYQNISHIRGQGLGQLLTGLLGPLWVRGSLISSSQHNLHHPHPLHHSLHHHQDLPELGAVETLHPLVMGGSSSRHACKQDPRVPLVCPLDLNESCKTNVFGTINQNSEKMTNVGLFNWSWMHRLEGGSFLMGFLAGIILTITLAWIYWRRRVKAREMDNRSRCARSASIFRRKSRMRDIEEDLEEPALTRGWRWPRLSWPS